MKFSLFPMLQGKKAYIMGILAIVYAVLGWFLGNIDALTAQQMIWAGLTTLAMRAGIKNSTINR